jgi:hypothetical protein
MHDGATIPGKHLYAYVRADNGAWWKIEEHEATEVWIVLCFRVHSVASPARELPLTTFRFNLRL